MARRSVAMSVLTAAACLASCVGGATTGAAPASDAVPITPPYGAWSGNLSVVLSPRESRIVATLKGVVDALSDAGDVPRSAEFVRWHVEPAAEQSALFALARQSLIATQLMFERAGILEVQRTDVVVGRSQNFIASTVGSLGCVPDLSRTGGAYLMGASLCGNRIITMDLSGLLFVLQPDQRVTPAMEGRAEPPLPSIPYQVVDRGVAVLSHEWAHAIRFTVAGSTQPAGEPEWFREGFAEWVALASRVRAFAPDMSYLDAHVIRTHLFSDWPSRCTTNVAAYRKRPMSTGGCEYAIGLLAVELLVARFGGFVRLVDVYRRSANGLRFPAAFRDVYGMSLAEFEDRATGYVSGVAQVMSR